MNSIINSYTYSIDETKGIVTKIYSGSVSKQAVMHSWKMMSEIELPANFNGLIINYNGAEFDFKPNEIEEIVAYFKKMSQTVNYNIATICVKPIHYVLSTLVEDELSGNTNATKTFSTEEGAEHFLLTR